MERRDDLGVDYRPALDVAGLGVAVRRLRREQRDVVPLATAEERELRGVVVLVVLSAEALRSLADGLDLGGNDLRELALRDAVAEEELRVRES